MKPLRLRFLAARSRPARSPTSLAGLAVLGGLVLPGAPAVADAPDAAAPTLALRLGWAYGLGAELEVRPHHWGVGASAGYVPGLGLGGYLSVQWGQRALTRSGLVAEAGAFRGVHNALRVAADGLGVYAQGGGQLAFAGGWSLRAVAGGGLPLTDSEHLGSVEFLAKLTFGRAL